MHSYFRMIAFLLIAGTTACSSVARRGRDSGADGSPDADGHVETDADGQMDADSDAGIDSDISGGDARPPDSDIDGVEDVPRCGDGVLDLGEQCDDGNRLNGDGCDWLCRLWDGELPPPAEGDAGSFEPEGEPTSVEAAPCPETDFVVPLPLAWTGWALTTALWETPTGSWMDADVRFRRFDPAGTTLYPEWTYPTHYYSVAIDLVWTGRGFGFFYSDDEVGIYFLALDAYAKPRGDPILIVEEPNVAGLAADFVDDRFVLVWNRFTDREAPQCNQPTRTDLVTETWARFVGEDGSTEPYDEPTLLHDWDQWHSPPDVATGTDGIGVIVHTYATPDVPECSVQFMLLDDNLESLVPPSAIAPTQGGQLLFDEDRFILGWTSIQSELEDDDLVCFAVLSATGRLTGAPICNRLDAGEDGWTGTPRFAVGEGGLLTLVSSNERHDRYLSSFLTDRRGVMTTAPSRLVDDPVGYAVTWMGDSYGALYLVYESTYAGSLLFQRFNRSE